MKKTLFCLVLLAGLLLVMTGCWGQSTPAPQPSGRPAASARPSPMASPWPDDGPTATPNTNPLPKVAWR